jgi:hypothetical protein
MQAGALLVLAVLAVAAIIVSCRASARELKLREIGGATMVRPEAGIPLLRPELFQNSNDLVQLIQSLQSIVPGLRSKGVGFSERSPVKPSFQPRAFGTFEGNRGTVTVDIIIVNDLDRLPSMVHLEAECRDNYGRSSRDCAYGRTEAPDVGQAAQAASGTSFRGVKLNDYVFYTRGALVRVSVTSSYAAIQEAVLHLINVIDEGIKSLAAAVGTVR